jgi:tetratricopeptide (TPR) repeat protein
MMRLIAFVLSFVLGIQVATASTEYLDYFERDPDGLSGRDSRSFHEVKVNLDQGEYADAGEILDALLDRSSVKKKPVLHAQLMADAGIIKAMNDEAGEGLMLLEDATERLATHLGPFDPVLFDPLMVQGVISADIGAYEAAEDAFRRAQHIAHRDDGVYGSRQLPSVQALTRIALEQSELAEADRQTRFLLRVNEQRYGERGEELVMVLQQVAGYFAHRGSRFPYSMNERFAGSAGVPPERDRAMLFRESVKLYDRAIQIIADAYGPDDARLIGPLRGLSRARMMQRSANSQAEKAMERVLELVETDPATDIADHARALVDLADLYTVTSDPRAEERYIEAWNMLADYPELHELRDQLFGVPTRIYPETQILLMDRKPLAAEEGEHLFADVSFAVTESGQVSNVEIVDANVPNEEKSRVRAEIRSARFRPRIADGEIVETPGLIFHQTFKLLPPQEPEAKISINASDATDRQFRRLR